MRPLAVLVLLALLPALPLAAADPPAHVSGAGDARGVVAVSLTGDAHGAVAVSLRGNAYSVYDTCMDPRIPYGPHCVTVLPVAAVSGTGHAHADKLALSGTGTAHSPLVAASGCEAAGLCFLQ